MLDWLTLILTLKHLAILFVLLTDVIFFNCFARSVSSVMTWHLLVLALSVGDILMPVLPTRLD